ncbi:MAG: prolipoprotein diacylglyceryl transferase family protein [Janthinobacterium lividum]
MTAAFLVSHGLTWGPLRATPYGLCAAVGLVAGMALARRSALRLHCNAEVVWDTGMFALISCFAASRLLLVMRDPRAFARYPLLVLGLPSLTFGGMLIAALMLWAYVRVRRKLTVRSLLDVFAAPAAVLAAALELGHWFEGSEVGMPTALPWAVRDPWNATPMRVHPVALYGVVAALLIALTLWRMSLRLRADAGSLAAVGLVLGGGVAFGLNVLTQPLLVPLQLRLEPGQWMALGAMLVGCLLWTFTPPRKRLDDVPLNRRSDVPSPTPLQYTEVR